MVVATQMMHEPGVIRAQWITATHDTSISVPSSLPKILVFLEGFMDKHLEQFPPLQVSAFLDQRSNLLVVARSIFEEQARARRKLDGRTQVILLIDRTELIL